MSHKVVADEWYDPAAQKFDFSGLISKIRDALEKSIQVWDHRIRAGQRLGYLEVIHGTFAHPLFLFDAWDTNLATVIVGRICTLNCLESSSFRGQFILRIINNLFKEKVAGVIYTDICHF